MSDFRFLSTYFANRCILKMKGENNIKVFFHELGFKELSSVMQVLRQVMEVAALGISCRVWLTVIHGWAWMPWMGIQRSELQPNHSAGGIVLLHFTYRLQKK